MSKTHIVQPGEYMETIAEQFGIRDYKVIYDHANNQQLKALRPNPHILLPGDKVFIPDMDPGQQPADTDKKHKFVITAQKVALILYIRRNGKPLANQSYKLEIGKQTFTGKTAADGLIRKDIPIGEPVATLTFTGPPAFTRKLNLGYLHPITTASGRQMRLNNLGFACGLPNGFEGEAYTGALRAFQRKYLPGNTTGKADPATIEKLRSEYEQGIPS